MTTKHTSSISTTWTRLGIVLFFTSLLLILALGWFTRMQIRLFNQELLKNIAATQTQSVEAKIHDIEQHVVALSQNPVLNEYLQGIRDQNNLNNPSSESARQNQVDIKSLAETVLVSELRPGYDIAYLMNLKGEVLVSTNADLVGNDYSFREYFRSALSTNSFALGFNRGVTTKQLGMYASHPVRDQDSDNLLGVLVLKIKPDVLHSQLTAKSPYVENCFIATEDGVIVSASDANLMLKTVLPLNSILVGQLVKNHFPGEHLDALLVNQQADIHTLDQTQFLQGATEEGVNLNIALDSFSRYNLMTGVVQNSSSPYAFWLSRFAIIVGLFLTWVLLTLSLFRAVLRQLYIPLASLASFSSIITRQPELVLNESTHETLDDFEKKPGEVGVIASALNHLINKTKSIRSETEERIEEKVTQQKRLNEFMIRRELRMAELKKEIKQLKQEAP